MVGSSCVVQMRHSDGIKLAMTATVVWMSAARSCGEPALLRRSLIVQPTQRAFKYPDKKNATKMHFRSLKTIGEIIVNVVL